MPAHLSRSLALQQLALVHLLEVSEDELADVLCAEYLDEHGETIPYQSLDEERVQTFLIGFYAECHLRGVSNVFLQKRLEKLYGHSVLVIGQEEPLEECPCCGYLTLDERGTHDICPMCHWEDVGYNEEHLDAFTYVNHGTLREYRLRFLERTDYDPELYLRAHPHS